MTTDPDQLRAQVAEVLADLPDPAAGAYQVGDSDIDLMVSRLEQAHELLVHALESVDKG